MEISRFQIWKFTLSSIVSIVPSNPFYGSPFITLKIVNRNGIIPPRNISRFSFSAKSNFTLRKLFYLESFHKKMNLINRCKNIYIYIYSNYSQRFIYPEWVTKTRLSRGPRSKGSPITSQLTPRVPF